MIKFLITALFFVAAVFSSAAQKAVDLDSVFREAQKLAYKKEYIKSRKQSRFILKSAPEYIDAAILIGRTYAWQQDYDSARLILSSVLEKHPAVDAFYALAQVEKWSGNINRSLNLANEGVEKDSIHIPLLLIKAELLQQLNLHTEARDVLNYVLRINSENEKAAALLDHIRKEQMVNQLLANYQITTFSQNSSIRHLLNLEYLYSASRIKYIGRLSYADQNEWQSIQAELEGYISIKENMNLFLAAGASDGNFFPGYRAGGEFTYSFPHGMEASLGARALFFQEETVLLYTGQIGKYLKRNWISARGFLQNQNKNVQFTGIFQFRHYLRSNDEYLSIIISQGSIPSTPYGLEEVNRLGASTAGINGQFIISNQLILGGIFTYEYEEFMAESYRHRFNAGIRMIARF